MATLNKPQANNGWGIKETCPQGAYIAVCLGAKDSFGVTRKKFQSDEEETVDLTQFGFGVVKDGKKYIVASKRMKISGHEKSALVGFLTGWGVDPFDGDYTDTCKGRAAQIKVAHEERGGKVYANIVSCVELLEGLEDKVPALNAFPTTEEDENDAIPY